MTLPLHPLLKKSACVPRASPFLLLCFHLHYRALRAFRATTVKFQTLFSAVEVVRAISQASLYPANCRLLDPLEALTNAAGDGTHAMLILTFELADHPVNAWLKRALALCADYGGEYHAETVNQEGAHRSGAAGQWRERFLQMPWFREALTARGIIADTFETAVTWEPFPDLFRSRRRQSGRCKRRLGSGDWSVAV